jgi:hypothetical protein
LASSQSEMVVENLTAQPWLLLSTPPVRAQLIASCSGLQLSSRQPLLMGWESNEPNGVSSPGQMTTYKYSVLLYVPNLVL